MRLPANGRNALFTRRDAAHDPGMVGTNAGRRDGRAMGRRATDRGDVHWGTVPSRPIAVLAATGIGLCLVVALASPAFAAGPDDPAEVASAIAPVALTPADLPPGFEPSNDRASSFTSLAHGLAGSLDTSPDARDVNPMVLERVTDEGVEFVTAVLIAPLSTGDQAAFDASVQQADRLTREAVENAFGDATVTPIEGMRTGVSRYAVAISAPDSGVEYRAVAARRGPVLEVIGHAWTAGVAPVTSLAAVAGILDARLTAAIGSEAPVFRPAGPLVPPITTHIPTPLDLSADPAVVGTNLVLTALALLLLSVSARFATRMLAEHEATVARRVPVVEWIGRAETWLGSTVGGRFAGGRLRELGAFLAVVLFYGVVFSLLEPTWEPLSVTGLWLLISFTIANAVVGMADDLVAWRTVRHWGLPAGLAVRPTSALVAVGSVGLSRVAAIVPGLMFGTPDALRFDEAALGEARARRLAAIGVVTLVTIAGVAWAITIATTGMARAGELSVGLAGIEALLLLVFAAALQNLFVALVGMRGSAGEILRARSPIAWGATLAIVTFLFFHALLNPQGDPATALDNRNVQVVMGLVGAFSVVVFAAWGVLRLTAPGRVPAAVSVPAAVAMAGPSSAPADSCLSSAPAMSVATPLAAPPAVVPATLGAAPSVPALEASIGTADGAARGRAWFRVADGWVMTRTQLVDPGARRRLRVFSVLSAAAWMVPFVGVALAGGRPDRPDVLGIGLLVVGGVWLAAVVVARLWLERYAVTQTAVFPVAALAADEVGRDWSLGCAFTLLLSPLVGLLYLLLARGRVLRVTAPFAADRQVPVTLRLKGSEPEARLLRHLLTSGR
jgi:hypothetical protein